MNPSPPARDPHPLAESIAALPKAELHLHLEGTIHPSTAVELAARYGDSVLPGQVSARYASKDFTGFIEAYRWVTSYLRTPQDYALIAREAAEFLLAQNIVYAEITLSAGVMLLRKQDPAANLEAIREAVRPYQNLGLRIQWIFDCVRQFGSRAAMEVARIAAELRTAGVVAFGVGGDELSLPAADFQQAFELAAAAGLHRVAHAGEIGGPDSVRDALTYLQAERIGHGIAATRDPALAALLRERSVPLEICPSSNLCTGALACQLGRDDASLHLHPLPDLFRAGVPLNVSTDDPAIFSTDLQREYLALLEMGISPRELARIAVAAFQQAFLPAAEKFAYISKLTSQAAALDLI